ncbi:hypothetical protein BdWA1_001747 [Babesia duncani]|uniref:Uncharacterized protein n=1 Tax=Babesia duncani TaxID=323732 RepID=A0AAD9PKS8_9APIC|nr:hypothetical protein BdWA1_001747 [Babesia duncani]
MKHGTLFWLITCCLLYFSWSVSLRNGISFPSNNPNNPPNKQNTPSSPTRPKTSSKTGFIKSFLGKLLFRAADKAKTEILNIKNPGHKEYVANHICSQFESWEPTNKNWDRILQRLANLGICKKNALVSMYDNPQAVYINYGELPQAIRISLQNLMPNENEISIKLLRKLAAIHFIGINPQDAEAATFWDSEAFVNKLRLFVQFQEIEAFDDISWKAKEMLEEIDDGNDVLDVATRIYNDLTCVILPTAWGGFDEMVGLSQILKCDFYLFQSNPQMIQRVSYWDEGFETRPSVLLYYYKMTHFCNAGLVDLANPQEIKMHYDPGEFPIEIAQDFEATESQ